MTSAWVGTVEQALSLGNARFVAEVEQGYRTAYGTPSQGEIDSWARSLPMLLSCLDTPGLRKAGLLVEFRMPVGEERADAVLLGGRQDDKRAYVVELKQWESAEAIHGSNQVNIPGWGRHQSPIDQAANYAGKIRCFHNEGDAWSISAGVWIHKMPRAIANAFSPSAGKLAGRVDLFAKGEADTLTEALSRHLTPVDLELTAFKAFEAGQYGQTRQLFSVIVAHAAEIADNATKALAEAGIGLTEEQELLAEEILESVSQNEMVAYPVQGGPGSGKTLLAVHLLLRTIRAGKRVTLAIRNHRLQAILKTCFNQAYPGAAGALVYFETQQGRGIGNAQFQAEFDLLICDEAQRMRGASMKVALARAPVAAVFLDETQQLNPPEEGTVAAFSAAAASIGRIVRPKMLTAAVRCRGGQAYHNWVEELLTSPDPVRLKDGMGAWGGRYKFALADSAENMIAALAGLRDASRARVAMVASFTESPGSSGPMSDPENLRVGFPLTSGWDKYRGSSIHLNWLMKADEYVRFWMEGESSRLERVASIYGAQGFESEYVGIFWGRDLVMRRGRWTLGDPGICFDTIDRLVSRKSPRRWTDGALELLLNRYRIFLTRGILGSVVLFEDEETLAWARSTIGPA